MRVTQDMIDPQLRLMGNLMARVSGRNRTVADLQKDAPFLNVLAKLPVRGVTKSEEQTRGEDGHEVRLVVLRPEHVKPAAPAVLWLHGGGYAGGSVDAEMPTAAALVRATGAAVVSPDYRLSREAPFPAARDDCYAGLRWLRDNAERLGGRNDQIVVMGLSAGGGLTAAVSLYARDRGEIRIAFQCPLYPMIDDRETGSSKDNDAPVWDQVTNQNAWRMYLGDLYGGDVPAYAAPARATDLAGLPPTITYVGGVEPFRDETVAYAERLAEAGVPVACREFPGGWHGFDKMAPWTRVAKDANTWFMDQFKEYLDRYTAPQAP